VNAALSGAAGFIAAELVTLTGMGASMLFPVVTGTLAVPVAGLAIWRILV